MESISSTVSHDFLLEELVGVDELRSPNHPNKSVNLLTSLHLITFVAEE